MNTKITLTSGKILVMDTISFELCCNIIDILLIEIKKSNIKYPQIKNLNSISDLLKLSLKDLNFNVVEFVGNSLFSLLTSKELRDLLFKAFERFTYDNIRITRQLFDDVPEARKDYYEICYNTLKEIVQFFFPNLISTISETMEEMEEEEEKMETKTEKN